MTYKEVYEKAEEKLEKGEITCGEFDELTKPLDEEIRPHAEWIPYPERLPEERQVVLVTLNPTVIKDATHPVIIARYTTEKDSWIHTIPDAVLAWMPLPEPYKGEGEVE